MYAIKNELEEVKSSFEPFKISNAGAIVFYVSRSAWA